LANGDVIEMAVALDHGICRCRGDLLDFLDIGLGRVSPLAYWISGDHARRRDDELPHYLTAARKHGCQFPAAQKDWRIDVP
jgi:hypothetical protein